jgi:hypothetical protein
VTTQNGRRKSRALPAEQTVEGLSLAYCRLQKDKDVVSSFGDFGLIAETDIINLLVWIVFYHHNGAFAKFARPKPARLRMW